MTDISISPARKPWLLMGGAALLLLLLYLLVSGLRQHRLFPELGKDVSSLRITDAQGDIEMKFGSDDQWRIPAFGAVPADPVKVADLIAALQKAKRGEDKTADPLLYDTIGLGKSAAAVQLRNSKGDLVVDMFLGNRSNADSSARFARLANDPQTFLLNGFETISSDGMHWSNAKPPKLDSGRLTQITLIEPSMQRMVLERNNLGKWLRTDAPATNEARATLLADAISNLQAQGLRSASSINWYNAYILLADSQDGLQLSLQTKRDGAVVWVRLNAAARQDAASDVLAEATSINNLRHMAFAVSDDAADVVTSKAVTFLLAQ
jgi:Domain of unknown function (DUF4340)